LVSRTFPTRSIISPLLPSFPPRRSSDLVRAVELRVAAHVERSAGKHGAQADALPGRGRTGRVVLDDEQVRVAEHRGELIDASGRAEEHTSELQSRFDRVCRTRTAEKKQH